MLEQLSSSDFEPFVYQPFVLTIRPSPDHAEIVRSLELVEIQKSQSVPAYGTVRQPFSLVFRDTAGGVFPQSIYSLVHSELGALEIFIVPIATGADGTRYQAVFN